jgi:hypothetical protein
MSTLATPEQLREQQDSSRALNVHYKLKLEKKTELQDQFEKKDFIFVNHILHQYDKYLEKSNETKDVKMRKGLLMLGKWNFLKDWIQERQDEKVFANLYKKLNENVMTCLFRRNHLEKWSQNRKNSWCMNLKV